MVERGDDRGRVMAVIFFPYQAGSQTLIFPSIFFLFFFSMQTLILLTPSHNSLTFLFISIKGWGWWVFRRILFIIPYWPESQIISLINIIWFNSDKIDGYIINKSKTLKCTHSKQHPSEGQFYQPFLCKANWTSCHINIIKRLLDLNVESVQFVQATNSQNAVLCS